MKRILILLLALLMCATAFYGCAKDEEGEGTGTVNTGPVDDELGNQNFGGADFTILSRSTTSYEHVGEYGADGVSQAVYERNLAVADRFGVNIKVVERGGDWGSRESFITSLRSEHMSGTGAYDLISTHAVYLGWMAGEGILTDLAELPTVDLSKGYWNQNLYNALNINGSCYVMVGDIAHSLYEYISVMFVNTAELENKQIVTGGINGIYDMVDNGTWTWDALYDMTKNYGTGGVDVADTNNTYALLFNTHANRAAMMAQDAYVYTRNADGKYELANTVNEKLLDAAGNLAQFFGAGNSIFYDGWGMDETILNPVFTSKRALFYAQALGQSSKFSEDMGEGYAVLPLPKASAQQANYYTICVNSVSGVAVMSVAKNYEMSGVITQALGKYGSEYVTPEYYERALKYRYASDPRCPEILDKIRDSLTIEAVTTFFDGSLSADLFRNAIVAGTTDGVTSEYSSKVGAAKSALEEFYTDISIVQA